MLIKPQGTTKTAFAVFRGAILRRTHRAGAVPKFAFMSKLVSERPTHLPDAVAERGHAAQNRLRSRPKIQLRNLCEDARTEVSVVPPSHVRRTDHHTERGEMYADLKHSTRCIMVPSIAQSVRQGVGSCTPSSLRPKNRADQRWGGAPNTWHTNIQ